MAANAEFFTVAQAPELIAAVAATLPDWLSYYSFDGHPHVRPLAVDTVTIAEADVPAALAALQSLPDEIAAAGELEPGWRTEDLVTALRTWGWATDARAGQVRLGGIWGDVVFPAHFAALLAVAPFTSSSIDAWVFGADREREPAVAVSFLAGGLTVHTDVSITYGVF